MLLPLLVLPLAGSGQYQSFQATACLPSCLQQVPTAHGKADLTLYRSEGKRVLDIYSRLAKTERASIDECYLDLTEEAQRRLAASAGVPRMPPSPGGVGCQCGVHRGHGRVVYSAVCECTHGSGSGWALVALSWWLQSLSFAEVSCQLAAAAPALACCRAGARDAACGLCGRRRLVAAPSGAVAARGAAAGVRRGGGGRAEGSCEGGTGLHLLSRHSAHQADGQAVQRVSPAVGWRQLQAWLDQVAVSVHCHLA